MAPSFEFLPLELLCQVVTHCENAKALLNLSLTCKRLNHFIHTDGFRVFVQHRFPSFQTPPYWKDAAHALTTWSRNWDRKAFIARRIKPYQGPHSDRPCGPFNQASRPRQTMGYLPVIDSYEEWVGGNWSSRKEIVAWGAGSDLIVRLKSTGDEAQTAWQAYRLPSRQSILDQHHHMHDWITYKEPGLVDGRDDITSVNIVRQSNHLVDPEQILVGRASGRLDRIAVRLTVQGSDTRLIAKYDTGSRPVRSATLSSASVPLLAACLADDAIALFAAITPEDITVQSLDEVSAIPPGQPGRTWSSRFLRPDRLAVGRGPSSEPLLVYGLHEAGLTKTPLRKYVADVGDSGGASNSYSVDTTGPSTSIYPTAPVAPSSAAGGAEGDIFLSGGYDGNVRLHDLRSPASFVSIFVDLVENSAIYSLLPLGRERFITGASRFAMLKVFDLRMSGGKRYHASNLETCNSNMSIKVASVNACESGRPCCDYHMQAKAVRSNYNIYLSGPRARNRSIESGVYSLSAPSPFSPTFYAGVEGAVVQFDVVSAYDHHPDPVFTHGLRKTGLNYEDVIRKWDPQNNALELRLYEQMAGNGKMRTQRSLRRRKALNSGKGWDESWDVT